MSVAPLKPLILRAIALRTLAFPRCDERGPIEAPHKQLHIAVTRATFPRCDERGPIEAERWMDREHQRLSRFHAVMSVAPLKLIATKAADPQAGEFPRCDERGPIEALL